MKANSCRLDVFLTDMKESAFGCAFLLDAHSSYANLERFERETAVRKKKNHTRFVPQQNLE